MFCYQCEQTSHGTGCTLMGICGKNPQTAALQDLLLYVTKGISMYAHRAIQMGKQDREVDIYTVEALFTTVTNVNFDPERLKGLILRGVEIRKQAKKNYEEACQSLGIQPEVIAGPAAWVPVDDINVLIQYGESVSILHRVTTIGADLTGLQELLTYGIKGAAAYMDHAHVLGKDDDSVYAFFHKAMNYLTKPDPTVDELLALNLECGEYAVKVLALLDEANTGAYGHPTPTQVRMGGIKGKALLVSGHDLKDLEIILQQTAGKGINVYTHGEMLPAHGYPELKKFPHFVGHYGGAWMRQKSEFDKFPGSIVMTTNCIQEPLASYKSRIFTSGLVAWPGVTHIVNRDFSPAIEKALECEGFTEDSPEKIRLVGFGHNAVLGVADQVIDAVKAGKIRHFFLIGGCDGAEVGRNYYTEVAEKMPDDCIILTLGCGKFRVLDVEVGDIGGIPRRLDMGQCNDSFSAIKVAQALADAFGTDINGLPLSLIISWYEQKAVCVLLALLHLGVKNIRLGPNLPAFVTPAVLNVLVEKFNIQPVKTAEEDLRTILQLA